jgi:hypothetical protein
MSLATFLRRAAGALVHACLVLACTCRAADLFVDGSRGDDAADGLSWPTARATVSSALSTATATPEPDTIAVAEGRYVERVVVPADVALLGGFPVGGGARDLGSYHTVLDGGGLVGPVVSFPPGSDGTMLDGFTVRGGWTGLAVSKGGGIRVTDSAPLIRNCVVEENGACFGAGIHVERTFPGSTGRIEWCVIRRNSTRECVFDRPAGGGIAVSGPDGFDMGTVVSNSWILENDSSSVGGVAMGDIATIESSRVERNVGGGVRGGNLRFVNVAVAENEGVGIHLFCGFAFGLENVTVAGNDLGVLVQNVPGSDAPVTARVDDSILWANRDRALRWGCTEAMLAVSSSIVEGGYTGGIDVLDADPLFVPGPLGDHYLSQTSAGQSTTSPAIDAGNRPSADLGLDQLTTATDATMDVGTVDMGYHYEPVAPLEILRGAAPNELAPHGTVTSLPFVDDAGTLTDPALPLLFYRIPAATNEMGVEKDLAADAPRLTFLGR